jgi:hypothetical protein
LKSLKGSKVQLPAAFKGSRFEGFEEFEGFWDLGFGTWVLGFGFWVLGFGFWVLGLGFWGLGFGAWDSKPD